MPTRRGGLRRASSPGCRGFFAGEVSDEVVGRIVVAVECGRPEEVDGVEPRWPTVPFLVLTARYRNRLRVELLDGQVEVFVINELVMAYDNSNHAVLRHQLRAVLAASPVILSHSGVPYETPADDTLRTDVARLDPAMPI